MTVRRREQLYCVTIADATGTRTVTPVNAYQLPGVLWAARKLYPSAKIAESAIGRGRINPDTREAEDVIPPYDPALEVHIFPPR